MPAHLFSLSLELLDVFWEFKKSWLAVVSSFHYPVQVMVSSASQLAWIYLPSGHGQDPGSIGKSWHVPCPSGRSPPESLALHCSRFLRYPYKSSLYSKIDHGILWVFNYKRVCVRYLDRCLACSGSLLSLCFTLKHQQIPNLEGSGLTSNFTGY